MWEILLIWKCCWGRDRLLMCDKHSNLGHVHMCSSIANQPHLHSQKEVLGLGQGTLQWDHSSVSLLLHSEISSLISGDYAEQHFISRHRIRWSYPENISRDRSVGGEADVVEGDSQREQETRRSILRELASYAVATAERKNWKATLTGWRATMAAHRRYSRIENSRLSHFAATVRQCNWKPYLPENCE